MDRYAEKGRSFVAVARARLCSAHRKEYSAAADADAPAVLGAFQECCAHKAGFLAAALPLREIVFRLFLASGNEPLTLDELGRRLAELDSRRDLSPNKLQRLLGGDQYYFFGSLPEAEEP